MKTYSDLSGDGGSRILDQVVEQRKRTAANLSSFRHTIAIGSGKGGVGKSSLAMLLALELARRGLKPAVLDADINGPSQARLGGLTQRTPLPGPNGLIVPATSAGVGVVSFGSLVPEDQAVDFESIAPGDSFIWRATREFTVLADFLARTDWSPFDVLLLDLPPGAERTFQYAEFLSDSTCFVLVTVPSDVSRGVVRRSVQALKNAGQPPVGYIENMKGYYCDECSEVRPLFPDSRTIDLGIPLLGSLPFDPKLAEACDSGLQTTVETSPATRDGLAVICGNLLRFLEAD